MGAAADSSPHRAVWWLVAAGMVVVIAAGAIFAFSRINASQHHTLTGTLTAPDCGGGYDVENAAIKVTDENGHTVGAGTTSGNEAETGCRVSFSLEVGEAKYYDFEIGTHGAPTYSKGDLEAANWHLDLSLT
jgi:hypothetical protein